MGKNTPYAQDPTGAAGDAANITPADGPLAQPARALYIGVAGDVVVYMNANKEDTAVTFLAVPAGTVLPISVRQVRATGTSATDIVALYA